MRHLVQQLELILEGSDDIVDPKDFDMKKEYARLNSLLFDEKLGLYPMKWNRRKGAGAITRLKRAGSFYVVTSVEMSTYYESTYQGFLNRLAHEMIHVFLHEMKDEFAMKDSHRHGRMFRHEMKRINGMGKGFNINVREDVTGDTKVNVKKGREKRFGVLLVQGNRGKGIIVFNDKAIGGAYDMMLMQDAAWLQSLGDMTFLYSMDQQLAKYPVKRKLGRRFGMYGIDNNRFKNVMDNGQPFAEIKNGEGHKVKAA